MDEFGPRRALQDHVELVLEIGLRVNAEHDLDRLLQLTVQAVKERLNYSYCAILLKEGTDLVIRAVTEYPETILGKRIPIGAGISGHCAQSKAASLVPDVTQCADYVHLGDAPFGSELDIPIVFRGKLLGVLNTESTRTNAFNARDVDTLKILATQLGVALYNAQIRTQLGLVQDIGLQLATIIKTEDLFPWFVQQIQERLHHDSCGILRVDGQHLVLAASTGGLARDPVGMQIPFGQGITGRCAVEKKVVNVGNVRSDAGYIASGVEGARSEIALPIRFEEELLGVLTIESSAEDAFDEDDVRLLSTLGAQAAVCIHQAQLFAESERMAVTDGLTGLYNYRYFHERLNGEIARSTRYGHPLSLVMVDLDDFKKINDRYGHLKGDDVLREDRADDQEEHPRVRRHVVHQAGGRRHRLALRRRGVHHHHAGGARLRRGGRRRAPAGRDRSGGGARRRPDRRERTAEVRHGQLRRRGVRARSRGRQFHQASRRGRLRGQARRQEPGDGERGAAVPSRRHFLNRYATFRKNPSLIRCRSARLSVRSVANDAP